MSLINGVVMGQETLDVLVWGIIILFSVLVVWCIDTYNIWSKHNKILRDGKKPMAKYVQKK